MSEIIQSLWIGRPLSLIEQLTIVSFLKNGHEFHLYCYDEVGNIPAGTKVMDASAILPASEIFYYQSKQGRGSVSAFSNWFRFKLLLEKGGWWADTDVVCVRPFDFDAPAIIATEDAREGGTKAASAVIKLPPDHEIARLCCEAASQADRRALKWGETGPNLLNRIVRERGCESLMKPPEFFCPLPHWAWRALVQPQTDPPRQIAGSETRAIHLWHELWRRAGVDLVPIEKKSGRARLWLALRRSLGIKPPLSANEPASPFAELLRRHGLKK